MRVDRAQQGDAGGRGEFFQRRHGPPAPNPGGVRCERLLAQPPGSFSILFRFMGWFPCFLAGRSYPGSLRLATPPSEGGAMKERARQKSGAVGYFFSFPLNPSFRGRGGEPWRAGVGPLHPHRQHIHIRRFRAQNMGRHRAAARPMLAPAFQCPPVPRQIHMADRVQARGPDKCDPRDPVHQAAGGVVAGLEAVFAGTSHSGRPSRPAGSFCRVSPPRWPREPSRSSQWRDSRAARPAGHGPSRPVRSRCLARSRSPDTAAAVPGPAGPSARDSPRSAAAGRQSGCRLGVSCLFSRLHGREPFVECHAGKILPGSPEARHPSLGGKGEERGEEVQGYALYSFLSLPSEGGVANL